MEPLLGAALRPRRRRPPLTRPRGAVAALALGLARPRAAQDAPAPATPSPIAPWRAPTLRADAFSLRDGPASLVFLDGFHSGVAFGGSTGTDDRVDVGWHTAAGLGRIAGLGFGVDGYGGATATTFGFGLGD